MLSSKAAVANIDPGFSSAAVTPHATEPIVADGTRSRGLYVGGAGNVVLRMPGDSTDRTFVAVPAGTFMPVCATHVRDTTTATSIIALF